MSRERERESTTVSGENSGSNSHLFPVVRPNDPRLALYPRRFVTDKQFLPKDHPETTRDLKMLQLPGLDIHKYDPTVRGKGRDRD